ncbi:MAG: CDGSH iron-sulfur domain-containing protein [Sphingobacteriales bacterium]|nr:CDGSH iron-sulfur domain-containing protein [Sphingobacteriales bacterium]
MSIKSESENKSESVKTDTEIVIIKNGPLQIKGSLSIKHKDGKEETQKEVYLCRCGQSENKPFCDGTHKKCGFKDE